VATERQIAANRRNAQKSTGPKTKSGKKRTSLNALRHGLASQRSPAAASSAEIKSLALQIAGDPHNSARYALALDAAAADIELSRVRRMRVSFIEEVQAIGNLHAVLELTAREHRRAALRGSGGRLLFPEQTLTAATDEASDASEAVRLSLPRLRALDRYERRAAARRDRALRALWKTFV
jgi:hypothetical protein